MIQKDNMEPKRSIGVSQTDRFLVHVVSNPERIRKALMRLDPRPWVYVVQTNPENEHYGYDIYVGSEWGGAPSDELFGSCQRFADNLVAPVNVEVGPTVAEKDFALGTSDVAPLVEVEMLEEEGDDSDEHGEKTS